MSASADDVVVIGAGPAGLATSACLRRAGVAHVVLERAHDVGSTWRTHYERLHLHTIKQLSALPFSPWPASAERYPSRAAVVEYLERYAREHAVSPRFGVEVTRVHHEDVRLTVETSAGTLTPRFVVVATGYNGVENRPTFPGLSSFPGSVVHTAAYRDPAPYAAKRTLVVGCGNSGAEIALDLAEHGVDVSMVVRGPVHVVPREVLGRPSQATSVLLSRLPVAVRDAILVPVLKVVVGDLSAYGIRRPIEGPTRLIEERGRIPLLDIGTIAAVKRGAIRVVPGVTRVDGARITFDDGQAHDFDALILATGYTPGLERIIAGFGRIADARGRPQRFGEPTDIPGLYFVGFKNPPTGALREIALEAPRVARSIALHLARGATAA